MTTEKQTDNKLSLPENKPAGFLPEKSLMRSNAASGARPKKSRVTITSAVVR
ncbi:hypothetical protein [Escherichia coli]|uniref:hypothetical protein n=1 Tax=Escherichia coli TaxID=562 RepID=UPI0030EE4B35